MELKETIELELKAIDFIATDYLESCNCAISKAVKRQIGAAYVSEFVSGVVIDDIEYSHISYTAGHFNADMKQATVAEDNQTIRTLTLTKTS